MAHAVDGGLVGRFLVPHADEGRGRDRRRLRDAYELEREVAVGSLAARVGIHKTPGGLRTGSLSALRITAPTMITMLARSARTQPNWM